MAETPTTSAVPVVVDKRTAPKGVMPKGAQILAMGGLALVILLVIVLTGQPKPTGDRVVAARNEMTAESTGRSMRDYGADIAGMTKRAQQGAAQKPSEPHGFEQPDLSPPQQAQPAQPDPLVEERRRRDYDSLFSSNVVSSRRASGAQPVSNAPGGRQAQGRTVPSLDDAAAAVVRASGALPYAQPATAVPQIPAPQTKAPVVTRTPPLDDKGPVHTVLEGTIIDGTLIGRLDGSSASPVLVLVSDHLFSHDRQSVLIPKGSRVIGETKPVQSFGETRLAVGFHRLIFPDGSSISLDQYKGLQPAGDNGIHDQVNNHYLSTFGAAAAVGVVSGLGQYVGSLGYGGAGSNRTVIVGNTTNTMGQSMSQVMNRFTNRMPTITIREGHQVKVYVTGDIELPAWKG